MPLPSLGGVNGLALTTVVRIPSMSPWQGTGGIALAWMRVTPRMRAPDMWRQITQNVKVETYALYVAYRDPRTPWYAKLLAAGVIAYAVSPVDLIPDFIPFLGVIDDLVLVPLGIVLAVKLIPREVMVESRERAHTAVKFPVSRTTKCLVAGIVIALWSLLAAVVLLVAFRIADM